MPDKFVMWVEIIFDNLCKDAKACLSIKDMDGFNKTLDRMRRINDVLAETNVELRNIGVTP
jgi:hypothetical protein